MEKTPNKKGEKKPTEHPVCQRPPAGTSRLALRVLHRAKMAYKVERNARYYVEARSPSRMEQLRRFMSRATLAALSHKHEREIARRLRQRNA